MDCVMLSTQEVELLNRDQVPVQSVLFPLHKSLWKRHEMIPSASKLKSSKWCRLSSLTLAGSQCRTIQDSKTIAKVTGNHSTSFSKNSQQLIDKEKKNLWRTIIAYILKRDSIKEKIKKLYIFYNNKICIRRKHYKDTVRNVKRIQYIVNIYNLKRCTLCTLVRDGEKWSIYLYMKQNCGKIKEEQIKFIFLYCVCVCCIYI